MTDRQRKALQLAQWDFRKVCRSGTLTEIVLGQAHLMVDLRALDAISLKNPQEVPTGCPTEPLQADRILFSDITAELASIYRRHGLRLSRLVLADPYRRYGGPEKIPSVPEQRIAIEGAGTIEDITRVEPGPNTIFGRVYRLDPVAPSGRPSEPPIEMFCNGDPQNGVPQSRRCYTTYVSQGDLVVEYEFRQDKRTSPEELLDLLPSGSIKEPEELPLVDARVRAWIREMRRK